MTKYYTNNFSIINLHRKASIKSEIVTQMIYGDSFSILKRSKKWLKIKIKEDGYNGFIKKRKFTKFSKPTHKVNILKSKVFKLPNKSRKIGELSFGSKIKVLENRKIFFKFSKGWINKNDVKPISFKEKTLLEKYLFLKILNISGVVNHLKE